MLADSVGALEQDAATLGESRRHRGAAVLRGFADEEAAKVLILLDIARAGWSKSEAVRNSLSAFYSHLGRLLYVQSYGGAPADVAEVRRYVDFWRQEFYLDGPMDVDWIFGNELITRREERLYVDLVEDEGGDRRWVGPRPLSEIMDEPFTTPPPASVAVQLVEAMKLIGLLTEPGMSAVQGAWVGTTVSDHMHWSDLHPLNVAVIRTLESNGLDLDDAELMNAARYVVEHWIFPLSTLDLKLAKVDLKDLRDERNWRMAREMGIDDDYGFYG